MIEIGGSQYVKSDEIKSNYGGQLAIFCNKHNETAYILHGSTISAYPQIRRQNINLSRLTE